METMESVQITRYDNGLISETGDTVIAEYSLTVNVNSTASAVIVCMPSSIRELVMGFLFCRGIIKTRDDLKEIHFDEGSRTANALLISGDQAHAPANIPSSTVEFAVTGYSYSKPDILIAIFKQQEI